jgi:hypothetical protein
MIPSQERINRKSRRCKGYQPGLRLRIEGRQEQTAAVRDEFLGGAVCESEDTDFQRSLDKEKRIGII